MSRSGYIDDGEQWHLIMWRGAVASAMRGKRGQAFLREMLAALEALPEPKLIAEELEKDGAVCAIGAVGRARGINMRQIDPYEREQVAAAFGIPCALACEIFWCNDEGNFRREAPEDRYTRVRNWIIEHIR